MTFFTFIVINILIIKSTHTNISVLDCYRFFLLAFKETFSNLDWLCSLFTAADNQFILLSQGICKTQNIFSIMYFFFEYTYNISYLHKNLDEQLLKSLLALFLCFKQEHIYKSRITVSYIVSSSKVIISVLRYRKNHFLLLWLSKG